MVLVQVGNKMTDIKDNDIEHPARYCKGGIECIDAIDAATCNLQGIEAFCTGNAIKYLFRWKDKEGVKSLKKAIWYIEHLISKIDNSNRAPKEVLSNNRADTFDSFIHSFKKTSTFDGIKHFYKAYKHYCYRENIDNSLRLSYDEFEMLCYLFLPELE